MIGGLFTALVWLALQSAAPGPESQPEPVINTGTGLLENCTYDAKASGQADLEFHLGLCIGFIKGVTNTWAEQNPGKVCAPDDLDNERLRDVVVTWLRSHPESLGGPAVGAVVSAVTTAFPCTEEIKRDRSSQDGSAWPA